MAGLTLEQVARDARERWMIEQKWAQVKQAMMLPRNVQPVVNYDWNSYTVPRGDANMGVPPAGGGDCGLPPAPKTMPTISWPRRLDSGKYIDILHEQVDYLMEHVSQHVLSPNYEACSECRRFGKVTDLLLELYQESPLARQEFDSA